MQGGNLDEFNQLTGRFPNVTTKISTKWAVVRIAAPAHRLPDSWGIANRTDRSRSDGANPSVFSQGGWGFVRICVGKPLEYS